MDIFLSVERRNYFFQFLCVLKWQHSHVTEYPKGKVKVARCDLEWFHSVLRAAAGRFIINQTFPRKPHSNLKKTSVTHKTKEELLSLLVHKDLLDLNSL